MKKLIIDYFLKYLLNVVKKHPSVRTEIEVNQLKNTLAYIKFFNKIKDNIN